MRFPTDLLYPRTVKAMIMLNDETVPSDILEGLGHEDVRRRVIEYTESVIEHLSPGQSLTIELTDDQMAPWRLTVKDAPDE